MWQHSYNDAIIKTANFRGQILPLMKKFISVPSSKATSLLENLFVTESTGGEVFCRAWAVCRQQVKCLPCVHLHMPSTYGFMNMSRAAETMQVRLKVQRGQIEMCWPPTDAQVHQRTMGLIRIHNNLRGMIVGHKTRHNYESQLANMPQSEGRNWRLANPKRRYLKWPSVQCFLKCRHFSLCCGNELSSGIELLLEVVLNEV